MSKKVNKSQAKRSQKAQAANKKQQKNSKRPIAVPYTVRLTLLPNSQTVLTTANFRNLALLRGILEEAVDNTSRENIDRFININIHHAKWLKHQRKIQQQRKASAWNKHEKERLNSDAKKHTSKKD